MKELPRMTARTRTYWRDTAGIVAICLAGALFFGALLYRATYHVFPGMMPTVVHWCGRDYETGQTSWSWAKVTSVEAPRQVRVVGSYPPIFGGRPLLAAPVAGPVPPGEPCAMGVYLRTGPGRYQPYGLEGGP
jgi:hypothetical protein